MAGQGDAGSIQVARALQQHTNDKLVELDLGYNEIKDDGACAIAQARLIPFPDMLLILLWLIFLPPLPPFTCSESPAILTEVTLSSTCWHLTLAACDIAITSTCSCTHSSDHAGIEGKSRRRAERTEDLIKPSDTVWADRAPGSARYGVPQLSNAEFGAASQLSTYQYSCCAWNPADHLTESRHEE